MSGVCKYIFFSLICKNMRYTQVMKSNVYVCIQITKKRGLKKSLWVYTELTFKEKTTKYHGFGIK